jgi:SAM-dependent methyltransferase/uncharacterized protein YbaR (Trm112 family)
MLSTTLPHLRCPCGGKLAIDGAEAPTGRPVEIRSGYLVCKSCRLGYLILAGIPLLVESTYDYLLDHVKGISKIVPDEEIPEEFRADYVAERDELQAEHIEEDLEAERVNALYLLNHYVRADSDLRWWQPLEGEGSPLIGRLVREHWDQGPFARIGEWVREHGPYPSVLELGCGVGGLHRVLRPHCEFYLGMDSSFASIALARHIALGVPYPGELRVPEDLIRGPVSREIPLPVAAEADGRVDFVVADVNDAPAARSEWDLSIALNTIDMLEDPAALPELQAGLLRKGGTAIQSCPYVWHPATSETLRHELPAKVRGSSARAVEYLYKEAGFAIDQVIDHQPWLFFKNVRQLELYSVHLFKASKR